jgi:hypothetical protein
MSESDNRSVFRRAAVLGYAGAKEQPAALRLKAPRTALLWGLAAALLLAALALAYAFSLLPWAGGLVGGRV